MEEQNLINTDGSVADTRNPQESAATGASNGSDFQSTADDTVLNQESQRELTVTKTGDPVDTPGPKASSNTVGQVAWGVVIAAIIVLVAFVIKRLIEEDDENYEVQTAPASTAKQATTKKPVKKPAKKKPASKSKKRRKSAKRR